MNRASLFVLAFLLAGLVAPGPRARFVTLAEPGHPAQDAPRAQQPTDITGGQL
jgi:hypothetical protein